jgi:hypothetical protein
MFKNLIDGWKARKAIKELEEHPIYGLILNDLRETLNDTSKGIGRHWSEDGKSDLISNCLRDVEQAVNSTNPTQAVRMRVIEFQLLTTKFDVLIMQKPTPFKELSGELKQYIPELAKNDKELEAFFYGLDVTPITFDDMFDAVLMRYWVLHLYMSAFNRLRFSFDDYHSDNKKDWFRASYYSFCIWHENTYRQELGLPSLIQGDSSDLKSIMYSTWINRAQEGHKELRLAWEKSWEDAFHEPSIFKGIEL